MRTLEFDVLRQLSFRIGDSHLSKDERISNIHENIQERIAQIKKILIKQSK